MILKLYTSPTTYILQLLQLFYCLDSSGEEDEDDSHVVTVIPKQLQESKQNTTTTTVLSLVVGRAQLSLCTDLPYPTEVNVKFTVPLYPSMYLCVCMCVCAHVYVCICRYLCLYIRTCHVLGCIIKYDST